MDVASFVGIGDVDIKFASGRIGIVAVLDASIGVCCNEGRKEIGNEKEGCVLLLPILVVFCGVFLYIPSLFNFPTRLVAILISILTQ